VASCSNFPEAFWHPNMKSTKNNIAVCFILI
jgi:hypothetical protein